MSATIKVNNSDGDQPLNVTVNTLDEFGGRFANAKIAAELGKRDIPGKAPWRVLVAGTVTCPSCSKTITVTQTIVM